MVATLSAMRARIVRLAAAICVGMTAAIAPPTASVGLTCIRHVDVEQSAREALAGNHPSWADAYIVGRVEGIARPLHAPMTLTVVPTHVFSGDPADRIRLAARADGPPDPNAWQIGSLYFLAVTDAPELEEVSGLVAPCAPNFRITATEQIDRLVDAAPDVDIREEIPAAASSDSIPTVAVAIASASALIGFAGWLAFGRRARRDRRA